MCRVQSIAAINFDTSHLAWLTAPLPLFITAPASVLKKLPAIGMKTEADFLYYSSPLKNVESSAFSVFLSSNSWGDRLVVSCCRLGRQQFGNADQVVGDQIEHEIGSDLGYAAMFCFAHRAVLFAPTEDAFDHRPARLR